MSSRLQPQAMDEEQYSEKAISSTDRESSEQNTNSSPKLRRKKSKKTKKMKRPDGVVGKKKRKTRSTSPKSGPTSQSPEALHAEDKSGYYRSITFGKPAMEDTPPDEMQEIQDVLTVDDDDQPILDLPLDECETEGLPSSIDYSEYKYDGNDGDNDGNDCETYGRPLSIDYDDGEIDLTSEPTEAEFKVASELSRVEYYDVESGVGVNPRSAAADVLAKIDNRRKNRKQVCLLIGVGVLTLLLLAGVVAGLSVGRNKHSSPPDITSPESPTSGNVSDASAKSVEVPEFTIREASRPKFLRFEDGKWVPVSR